MSSMISNWQEKKQNCDQSNFGFLLSLLANASRLLNPLLHKECEKGEEGLCQEWNSHGVDKSQWQFRCVPEKEDDREMEVP